MPIVDRTTLYGYFETGDRPTENQFQDLIDSNFNLAEDSIGSGWHSQFARYEESTDSLIISLHSIPLNASTLQNFRIVAPVSPDASADVELGFSLSYYTDIAIPALDPPATITLYESFNKYVILSDTIVVPVSSTTVITLDEMYPVNQNLLHNELHFLSGLISITAANFVSFPIMNFEFN